MKPPVLLVASLLLWSAGCAETATDPAAAPDSAQHSGSLADPAVRITLNPRSATIRPGGSLAFTTVVRADRGQEVWPEISWSSSDTTIARVSHDGVVTGILPGDATITARCLGAEQQARITVEGDQPPFQGAMSWSFMLTAAGLAPLYDVWGSSPTDVFAVGSSRLWDCCGTILHYDGVSWTYMSVPGGLGELLGIWGSSANDVFAVGWDGVLHYDGTSWSRMPVDVVGAVDAVWGTSPTDVYAVGMAAVGVTDSSWYWRALILHYDGVSWKDLAIPPAGNGEGWLTDVWGTSARDVFAVGSAVLHYDGTRWSVMTTPPFEGSLHGVWGSAGNNVFAVGSGGVILHYDGSSWQTMSSPPRRGDLMGIWGNSGSDVFAVGDRQWWGPEGCCSDVLHYDGATWQVQPRMTGQALFDVWATPNQAFIVGAGPTIIQGRR
jgi:hypothetical protein